MEVVAKTTFEKYAAYKDSGAKWIGQIPVHWKVEKGKWLFTKNERPVRSEDDVITCFRDGEVTLRSNRRTDGFTNAIKEHGYQGIRKGDLVIHAMDAFAGAIGVSDSDGKSTPVYSVCTERFENTVNQYYYSYFLRSLALNGVIVSLAKGIRERSTDFRFNDFGELLLSFPPLQEQTAIASFLDDKTAKIDQAIAQKEKLIELLKERKQIIIQQAVTKGLDANVKLKDSGVEWIGEIPEHWEVEPIKYSLKGVIDCEHKTAPFVDEKEYFVVRTSNVKNGKLTFDNAKYTHQKGFIEWTERGIPTPGDILLTREAPAGEACLVPNDIQLCLGQRMVWLKVDKTKLIPQLGIYFIYSSVGRTYIDFLSAGSTVLHFNMADIKNIPIISIPLTEQQEIVTYIETQSAKIDKAMSLQQRQIEKLKEYRATLIDSAVTGKIKVS
ncbi:MAG: restriction endonuclease subunit S [Marinilabiliaceae bacterium]|nr:restriction endonuclease subunit S [Marinilabiliaceae bacterium]